MPVSKALESDDTENTTIEWGHKNEIPVEEAKGIHQVHLRKATVSDAKSMQWSQREEAEFVKQMEAEKMR